MLWIGNRAAIEQIAEELCQGRETVEGSRVVEIIDSCKHKELSSSGGNEAVGAFSDYFQTQVSWSILASGFEAFAHKRSICCTWTEARRKCCETRHMQDGLQSF